MAATDTRALTEQVELIYKQTPVSVVISIFVASMMCFTLRDVADRRLLIGFVAVVAALGLGRAVLVRQYRRRPAESPVRQWERRFFVTLVLTAAAWGVGGVLVMPSDSLSHQALVYFFLMGMAGGAAASYAAHFPSVATSIAFLMLPSTLYFAWRRDATLAAMAVGGVIYVAAAFRATRLLDYFLGRSYELASQLDRARAAAELLASTDELTGLNNRRSFRELAGMQVLRSRREGTALSALMMDIDRFKAINDRLGHAAGDAALRHAAQMLRQTARVTDIVGRWGGEEFALVLPSTSLDQAAVLAERLRAAVADGEVEHEGQRFRITCSIGVAKGSGDEELEALLGEADVALYGAKDEGRNRVARREIRPRAEGVRSA